MPKLSEMSKDEQSLLLYLEARVVDNSGSLDTRHTNDSDRKILEFWAENGFIKYGRITFKDATRIHATNWCQFSPEAWDLAHQERRDRAKRMWKNRSWDITEELRSQLGYDKKRK